MYPATILVNIIGEKMYKIPAAKEEYGLSLSCLPRQKAPNPLKVITTSNTPLVSTSPSTKENGIRLKRNIQSVGYNTFPCWESQTYSPPFA